MTNTMNQPKATPYASLRSLSVAAAMHPGLISCPPDTTLRTLARMMATYRVHAILVWPHGQKRADDADWAIVTDTDILRAAASSDLEQPAATVARAPAATIGSANELSHAAELMVLRGVSHLVVLERHTGRPVGVLSTLDIARALAGFPEQHPAIPWESQ